MIAVVNDRIVMNGSDLSGLNFEQTGNNLVGSVFGTSLITVDGQYDAGKNVESLQFESSASIFGFAGGGASIFGYALGSAPYLLNTDTDPTRNGGDQNDLIAGSSAGGEILNGSGGNDLLFGNGGADTLNGGVGNDLLVGGAGADTLDGSDGNDTLVGGLGEDTVNGGTGDDHIGMDVTSGDVDEAHGGVGTDTLVLSGGVPSPASWMSICRWPIRWCSSAARLTTRWCRMASRTSMPRGWAVQCTRLAAPAPISSSVRTVTTASMAAPATIRWMVARARTPSAAGWVTTPTQWTVPEMWSLKL